ncbi:MAG: hypothetical protein ACWA40_09690 [Planktomarina sp.]
MLDDKSAFEEEIQKQRRLTHQARNGGDFNAVDWSAIPASLQTDYVLDNASEGLNRSLQHKYTNRRRNIRRCWNRCRTYVPELMHHGTKPQKVLEMSTAHGGMLEVLRHFGHDVMGNDYANMVGNVDTKQRALFRNVNDSSFDRAVDDYGIALDGDDVDWPYRKITESINLPMAIFDAGHTPYPFEVKQFDYLLCFQAIEHYCHPKDWMVIVDEFCRITRKSIILHLNPILGGLEREDGYEDAFRTFVSQMMGYRRNGFTNVSIVTYHGDFLGFKLVADW